MGWVKRNGSIPNERGSARYAISATLPAITSAAGAGNRKAAQIGEVHWVGGVRGVTAKAARYLSYLTGAVTDDAAAKLRTSIQGKTAGARTPDGTILNAGVGANNAFSDDSIPAANSWITVDLLAANAPTLTEGQMVSIVHEIDPDNVGTTASVLVLSNSIGVQAGADLVNGFTSPTWTPISAAIPNVMLTATDGTYGWIGPLVPGQSYTSTVFNSGTNPNRVATVFTADMDMLISGVKMGVTNTLSAGTFDAVMRDMAGAQIGNNTQSFTAAEIGSPTFVMKFADGEYLFRRGSQFMISLEPTTADNITVGTIKYPNATIQAEASMGVNVGLRFYDGAAWGAVDTLSRTVWNLIVAEEYVPDRRNDFGGFGSGC